MPPILAERRKKLATFVPQAEALLVASLRRAGPGVRSRQRGGHAPFILHRQFQQIQYVLETSCFFFQGFAVLQRRFLGLTALSICSRPNHLCLCPSVLQVSWLSGSDLHYEGVPWAILSVWKPPLQNCDLWNVLGLCVKGCVITCIQGNIDDVERRKAAEMN